MSQWKNTDATGNSVLWTGALVNKAPNTANRDALYGNTTADAFVTGQTVGVWGADPSEKLITGTYHLRSATVTNGGTSGSYVPGDNLTFAGGTGTAAVANVTHTEVRTAAIGVAGTGYANDDVVSLATGTGTAATITVTTDGDGIPTSLALTTAGSYTANPTLSAGATTGGTGSGLTVTVTMKCKTLALKTEGVYTVAPTNPNTPTGGSGTGATITGVFQLEGSGAALTHTGWVLRREGSGGRAGRVTYETLVAGNITTDASDDTILPE